MSSAPQTTDYHAKYLAHLLLKRGGSDKMERLAGTMRDAKIELTPHQVEAALFAFRSPLSKGVILADEVGLGKTIEAGLVISQKWAERKRRILIIVPANLRKQWNQELLDKFYLPSVILETKSFKEAEAAGNPNPFIQNEIVICSYHFASRQYEILMAVKWDLVVIDEAHKLRNVYKASNRISTKVAQICIADKSAYSIAEGALIICLDDNLTNPAIQAIAALRPVQCICLDAAFHENDQLKTNAVQTMESAKVQFRTV